MNSTVSHRPLTQSDSSRDSSREASRVSKPSASTQRGVHIRPRRAIVIGGSMSGIVGSRVLSERFDEVVLIERDRFPTDEDTHRAGTPQSWHHHVLLSRGVELLCELFPGLERRMDDAEIPQLDYGRDAALISRFGELTRFDSGVKIRPCRRNTLDRLIVAELRRVERVTIREQARVERLLVDERGSGPRVCGVVIRAKDAEGRMSFEEVRGDLVVDASGARSHLPRWLDELGFEVPEEEVVDADLGYASRLYEPAPDHESDWSIIGITTRAPDNPRAAGLWRVEGGRWICSLIGTAGHYPPTSPEGFSEFARDLPDPRIRSFLEGAKPLTKIRAYRGTKNRWRHYENMKSFPAGLVALGTTMCSYNPLYGQGMTVVTLQAIALGELTSKHITKRGFSARGFDSDFSRRAHRAIAREVRFPWLLATLEDWRWGSTQGARPSGLSGLGMRVANSYIDRLLPLATRDAEVTQVILDVMNMRVSPLAFAKTSMLRRYLLSFFKGLSLFKLFKGRAHSA